MCLAVIMQACAGQLSVALEPDRYISSEQCNWLVLA